MSIVFKLVKSLDIYGNFFNLRINRSAKFKSVIGGFLSLITMVILIFCIVIFGKDFYSRTNPKVTIEEGLFDDRSIPFLKGSFSDDVNFTISIPNEVDDIAKFQVTNIYNNSLTISYLPKCSVEYLIDNSLINDKSILSLHSYFCFNVNDYYLGSPRASGNFTANVGVAFIKLVECDKISNDDIKKNNLRCTLNQKTKINSTNIKIYKRKIAFSPTNRFEPFKSKTELSIYPISTEYQTVVSAKITLWTLLDDLGWIISDFNTTLQMSCDPTISITQIKYSFPYILIQFEVNDAYKKFTRIYSKLQDLLASVGGFMKLIFTILNIINFFIRNYLLDWYLIDTYISNTSIPQGYENKTSLNDNSCLTNKSKLFLKNIYF
jgi:hypothetical protein